jgi:phosphopantetheinyl transferase (holo-ACP synthase)
VAIDVETIADKALRIRERFLSAQEQTQMLTILNNESLIATLAWSAKETMFKYCGLAEVDFIRHLEIKNIVQQDEHFYLSTAIKKNGVLEKNVHVLMGATYVLTYMSE